MACRTSIYDGIPLATLQARLAALQDALFQLQSGGKVATATYTQGDGAKSVSYTQANIADLTQAIIGVQTAIDRAMGIFTSRRPSIRPYF